MPAIQETIPRHNIGSEKIDDLAEKLRGYVGEEILVCYFLREYHDSSHFQCVSHVDQNIYNLARLRSDQLIRKQREIPAGAIKDDLFIDTGGYVYKSMPNFGQTHEAQFIDSDMVVPQHYCLLLVGGEEISRWRRENPSNEKIYQSLSKSLEEGLTGAGSDF